MRYWSKRKLERPKKLKIEGIIESGPSEDFERDNGLRGVKKC